MPLYVFPKFSTFGSTQLCKICEKNACKVQSEHRISWKGGNNSKSTLQQTNLMRSFIALLGSNHITTTLYKMWLLPELRSRSNYNIYTLLIARYRIGLEHIANLSLSPRRRMPPTTIIIGRRATADTIKSAQGYTFACAAGWVAMLSWPCVVDKNTKIVRARTDRATFQYQRVVGVSV